MKKTKKENESKDISGNSLDFWKKDSYKFEIENDKLNNIKKKLKLMKINLLVINKK